MVLQLTPEQQAAVDRAAGDLAEFWGTSLDAARASLERVIQAEAPPLQRFGLAVRPPWWLRWRRPAARQRWRVATLRGETRRGRKAMGVRGS